MNYHDGEVVLDGTATTTRSYEIILRTETIPAALRLDNKPLNSIPQAPSLAPSSGWWYDAAAHEVHAAVQAASFHLEVSGVH
jgi:hypothetical protein